MRRNHSNIACSCHIYMGVVLRTHPVHGESHIQRNANGEVARIDRLDALLRLWCGGTPHKVEKLRSAPHVLSLGLWQCSLVTMFNSVMLEYVFSSC